MQLVVVVPALCLALAGCNSQGRSGQNLTQDPGECGKFQWGTPEMALCLDTVAAARAAAEKPVAAVQPAQPPPPALQPQPPSPPSTPAPQPVVAAPLPPPPAAAPVVEAPAAELPVASPPESDDVPKSWWPFR